MPSQAGPWKNPRWNSLKSEDADTLRQVFLDLQEWLKQPTFENGVNVGSSTAAPTTDVTTGVTTRPPTTNVALDTIGPLSLPDDGGSPTATAGLVLTPGIGSIFAKWTAASEVDVANGWGMYRVQLSTVNTFVSTVVDKTTGGTQMSFSGLTTGTTYYVRVAAVDVHGNQGAFGAAVSSVPIKATGGDIAANSITAAHIVANTITASEIAADAITASELSAVNIDVAKYIRSASYVAGSSGFDLEGNGNAEFNNVTARGNIHATTLTTQTSGASAWIDVGAVPSGGGGTTLGAIEWFTGSSIVATSYGISGGGMQISATNTAGTPTGSQLQLSSSGTTQLGTSASFVQLAGSGAASLNSNGGNCNLNSASTGDINLNSGRDIFIRPASGHYAVVDQVGGGIVVKAANGSTWLIGVSNAGVVQTASV